MDERPTDRATALFEAHRRRVFARTDRLFSVLLPCQWIAAIAAAVWIAPATWAGQVSRTHVHVWAAVFLGGAITVVPLALTLARPGRTLTRHVVATGQMLMAALLIHLTGGRIETHFHVFGSLAFLALYRDWTVLVPATIVVALDHGIRGVFWPQSVYGVLAASPWRWAEHAGWVIFMDVVLAFACRQSVRAMHESACQQAGREEAIAESTSLARVASELISSLDTPVLLERLCQLTAEVLQCEVSHTLLWRPEERVYVWVAGHGATAQEEAIARAIRLPREVMATLFSRLDASDVAEVGTVPPEVLSRSQQAELAVARQLCMALRRGTDIIGLQVATSRGRREPFSARQRRIAEGIARVASMALANAQLVDQLTRASRLKSEFVSTMSHELRTPLNVILGFTEMLRDPAFADLDRMRLLDGVDDAGRQLLELIEGTLEIGRLEAGREDVSLERIALRDFWRRLGERCATIPRAPGVGLVWAADVPDVTVITDPRKLAVIVRNLVGNALKFTERGSVRVQLEHRGDALVLCVTDTGIGIGPADQEAVFEMFRQADGSDSRRYGGTGLGLYIVRRFARLLGGDVALESAPGRGSTFTVTLPCAFVPPAVRPAA